MARKASRRKGEGPALPVCFACLPLIALFPARDDTTTAHVYQQHEGGWRTDLKQESRRGLRTDTRGFCFAFLLCMHLWTFFFSGKSHDNGARRPVTEGRKAGRPLLAHLRRRRLDCRHSSRSSASSQVTAHLLDTRYQQQHGAQVTAATK